MIIKREEGATSLLVVFLLSMVGVIIGVSLVKTGYYESIMGKSINYSAKAYYAANSGLENAIREIALKPPEFGNPGPDYINFDLDGVDVKTKVTGDENQKTIEAIGTYFINLTKYSRKIEATIINTSITPDFSDAVYGGFGGVYLDNNTVVSNLDPAENGNVYSRSFIKGKNNDNNGLLCKNSSSAVYGNATAVGSIGKWGDSDKGVCITENAYAGRLEECFVAGDAEAQLISANCEIRGTSNTLVLPPEEKGIPNIGVDAIASYLASKEQYDGNCEVGGNPDLDCTNGTGILGDITINGDLKIIQNSSLLISGSILINGNVDIQSNSTIGLVGTSTSRVVISRGKISSASNVTYSSYDNVFIIFISTDDSSGLSCDSGGAAIEVSSNDQSVLFVATKGCILVRANQTFRGAIYGEAISLSNNSQVLYNPELSNLVLNISDDGGWLLVSFKEY
jgi:hypothetical protein